MKMLLIKKIARLQHVVIFVSITLLSIIAYMIGVPFLDLMEFKTFDLRFQSRTQITPGSEIVLAVIDEKSIAKEGKWIWPRSKIAELVSILSAAGARVIAFDIGFLEPDNKRIVLTVNEIQRKMRQLNVASPEIEAYLETLKIEEDNDLRLAKAIQNSNAKVVLGYFFQLDRSGVDNISGEMIAVHQDNVAKSKYSIERYASEYARNVNLMEPFFPQSNIQVLSSSADYSGYFNMYPDPDGVVRWLSAVHKFKDRLYAPLSLVTAGAFLGESLAIQIEDYGVRAIQIGDRTIPTDESGRVLINYRGNEKSFRHISVTDILSGTVAKDTLKDKIVMVGATAVGIYDLRVTPFGSIYPGIEIHANIVDSILAEDFLYRPNWAGIFDVLAILFTGLLLGFILQRISVIPGIIVGFSLFFSYIVFCQFLFSSYGLVLNLVYPLSVISLVYVSITAYRYFVETKQKRFIKNAFSTYLAPSVVNRLIESPDNLKLGGENREITAFFSDVQGFTSISEALSPRELVELLNEFLTEMTDIILKHEGTVDKFEGDAIIAFFGAPNILPDQAERSCKACIEMQRRLAELRSGWSAADKPLLKMRIGMCTGPAVVGNMGSENRLDYTMMGDTVNTAARLEGVNKIYGIYTLISESTYQSAGNRFAVREIDTIHVVGKKEPVTVYQLVDYIDDLPRSIRDILSHYQQGLQLYRQREWKQALTHFNYVLEMDPDDGPSLTMRKRCEAYQKNPPTGNWIGVYDMRTK